MKASLLLLIALTSFCAVDVRSQDLLRFKSTFDTGGSPADGHEGLGLRQVGLSLPQAMLQ
ncbi:MAG: hypothetical protein ACJ754_01515 [Pyrinomonadaceae bacterium]